MVFSPQGESGITPKVLLTQIDVRPECNAQTSPTDVEDLSWFLHGANMMQREEVSRIALLLISERLALDKRTFWLELQPVSANKEQT